MTPKPGREPKYTVRVSDGAVSVFHPHHATPLECSEQTAGLCVAMHSELVYACEAVAFAIGTEPALLKIKAWTQLQAKLKDLVSRAKDQPT